MDTSLEFASVFREDRGSLNAGRLKLSSQNMIFKNSKTGKVDNFNISDIDSISWQRLAADFGIRVLMTDGRFYRFGGMKESEYDKLSKFISSNYNSLELRTKELSLKGCNWGNTKFDGKALSFDLDGNISAFEIPLNAVSNCTGAKNEATLEFHQNDDAAVGLMEMRFHIPASSTSDSNDPVKDFVEHVVKEASVLQITGESIVTFSELQCITPRGRYDIKLFPSFIQLHGKTFDYKIPVNTVLRLFQLPHKDGRQVFFIIAMDPPILHGQTRYNFLQLLFYKEDEIDIKLDLSEKELKEKYDGKLEKKMSGPAIEVFAKIIKVLVFRKITTPDYTNSTNSAITCSYRNNNGLLYPLERGFIYINKPPIHIRFEEINSINFARSGGSTKSFDFEVETKTNNIHIFSSIEKDEYGRLYEYVVSKKLRIKNMKNAPKETTKHEDFGDSDDEGDAYLQRVREEGRIREQGGDSEDEEEDEDFNPEAANSSSDESPDEEFDSDAPESDDSEEESDDSSAKRKKSSKKSDKSSSSKKVKKEKPAKSSSKKSSKPSKPSKKSGDSSSQPYKSAEFVEDSDSDSD